MADKKSLPSADEYTITVKREFVDGEWVYHAWVAEIDTIEAWEDTREAAYALVIDAIETLRADALAEGRPFPVPSRSLDDYTGRVTLRLPRSLHRKVAVLANENAASLNTFLVALIAQGAAECSAGPVTRASEVAQAVARASEHVRNMAFGVPRLSRADVVRSISSSAIETTRVLDVVVTPHGLSDAASGATFELEIPRFAVNQPAKAQ